MRTLFGFLLALVLLVPQTADAARRDERTTQATRTSAPATTAAQRTTRPAAQRTATQRTTTQRATPQRTASQRAARPTAARTTARAPARSNTRPGDVRSQRQGVVVRGASAAAISRTAAPPSTRSCRRSNGRTVCTTQRRPAPNPVAGWHRGLSNASMAQRDCPVGTFATLARGHDDIVRCMPL